MASLFYDDMINVPWLMEVVGWEFPLLLHLWYGPNAGRNKLVVWLEDRFIPDEVGIMVDCELWAASDCCANVVGLFETFDPSLLVVGGGKGWLIGSSPRRNRLAFWFSFSQACARICSATTDVKWDGIGLFGDGNAPATEYGASGWSLVRLWRLHDFK